MFDYAVATPSTGVVLYKSIAVSARARDFDGKTVTYSWKVDRPTVGTFAPLSGPSSTFTCNASGIGTRVIVTASNGECTKDLITTISCVNDFLCGNGVVDPGETCDVGLTPTTCPADCTYVCGDGIAEAPAEDCDPGNTVSCSSTCRLVERFECGESLGKCYCGTLDTAACSAAPFTGEGSPNGFCVKEIQAGMPGVTTNSAVLGGLTATSRPSGAGWSAAQLPKDRKQYNMLGHLRVHPRRAGVPVTLRS